MKRLYEHISNVITSVTDKFNGNITVQRYEESKAEQVGIILMSSRNDEVCMSGEELWEAMKLEIHITCKDNASDIFDNIDILRSFVCEFEKCESTVDGLDILWAKHLGSKVRPSYTNGYGLQVIKCVIDFNYEYID